MSTDVPTVRMKTLFDDFALAPPLVLDEGNLEEFISNGSLYVDLWADLRHYVTKDEALLEISKVLKFRYTAIHNWNAFTDMLSDLSWLRCSVGVLLLRASLLLTSGNDGGILFNCIQKAGLQRKLRIRIVTVLTF